MGTGSFIGDRCSPELHGPDRRPSPPHKDVVVSIGLSPVPVAEETYRRLAHFMPRSIATYRWSRHGTKDGQNGVGADDVDAKDTRDFRDGLTTGSKPQSLKYMHTTCSRVEVRRSALSPKPKHITARCIYSKRMLPCKYPVEEAAVGKYGVFYHITAGNVRV